MAAPFLATKLYIPPPRPKLVSRPRLLQMLNEGLGRKFTLVSAPAGFGKTTLLSEWLAGCERLDPQARFAWLSLGADDSDPARFLAYLIAALQTVDPEIGAAVLPVLQSPQPPPIELILTTLLNEVTALPVKVILILDDFHVIDSGPVGSPASVDGALAFLAEHLPPQLHLVIATREDPPLPLARYRARDQLTELRAADLRFTLSEAAGFLKGVMGLDLSPEDIAALEARTEGWIAGLQLAALALQGAAGGEAAAARRPDASRFIQSFSGEYHFVLDYLVEEVLQQQPEDIQSFLLRTSILERLCGPLCDAVMESRELRKENGEERIENSQIDHSPLSTPYPRSSQSTLEYLEKANLFIIPLDGERRWYRYHHLFADLLRQRNHQNLAAAGEAQSGLNALHLRASQWYEVNDLDLEAFHHAAAANDIDRAERLIEGKGIPLHFRGAVRTILSWLGSLPKETLDARPLLWWRFGALLLINGQTTGVEEKLQAAETGLGLVVQPGAVLDEATRNLIGQIAAARATLALTRYDAENMLSQSRRALEYLHPTSLFSRANAHWTMGYAYLLQGERAAARWAFTEGIALSRASGTVFQTILTTIGLGNVQELENELQQAAETYRVVLNLAGDQPLQIIHEAHLGLARVLYEWNDLEAAERHGRLSLSLARQYDRVIDRFILCEVFLARLKLAWGEASEAAAMLSQAAEAARRPGFQHRLPEVAAAQVLVYLRLGELSAAAGLAQQYPLPLSLARVRLAQGDPAAALAALEPWRGQVEANGLADERLRLLVMQALALQALGQKEEAVQALGEALALAEPSGFIRTFLDEGAPVGELLSSAVAQGVLPVYTLKLLAAFEAERERWEAPPDAPTSAPSGEPLSPRELEILQLIAQGLSNREISERLFLALDTVKGHNRNIYGKLQVSRRTEAVARARELGLL